MSIFFDFVRTSLLRSKELFFSIQNIKKCFFMAFLLKKKHIRKRSIFWQKPWTNPFGKCRFFRLCENFIFQVQKTLCSFQTIKKCFFIAFCPKKSYKKKVDFLTKSVDETLCKMSIFLKFFRSFLLWSKKHSLLSTISKNVSLWLLFAQKKNIWEKGPFFDKNHGLTHLQNVVFFDFVRTSLLGSKKLYFQSRISKNVSFWLFLLNKTYQKKVDFWTKTMD